jgi:pimeloyl-ACP methyl ester carboxylesterase
MALSILEAFDDAWTKTLPFQSIRAQLPAERFVRVDGQLVHAEQAGTGKPVVLLHGFGCSSYSWRRVLPALARDFRVIAPDLNGFGYSERPAGVDAYTVRGQARLVLRLLDTLGIRRTHVVGHSYGGAIAIWLAARHRQRLRSMTLVDPALPDYDHWVRQRFARYRSLGAVLLRSVVLSRRAVERSLRAAFFDPSLVTPDLVAAYRDRLRVEGCDQAYRGLCAPIEAPPAAIDFRRLRVATLVVWGREDRWLSLPIAARRALDIPGAERVELERCGHAPMEERPEEFAAAVMPFLRRHSPLALRRRLGRLLAAAAAAAVAAPPPVPAPVRVTSRSRSAP